MSDHCQTVYAIYDAFGKGDAATILSHLADGIEWEYGWAESSVPWLVPGRGRDHVGRFFATLAEHLEFNRFEIDRVLGEGDLVIALINLDATVKSTGRRIVENDEVHIWYLDDAGKARKFRHAVDTLQHLQAFRGEIPAQPATAHA